MMTTTHCTHQEEPECPEVGPRPHDPVLDLAQEGQHHLPGEGKGQAGDGHPGVITSMFRGRSERGESEMFTST